MGRSPIQINKQLGHLFYILGEQGKILVLVLTVNDICSFLFNLLSLHVLDQSSRLLVYAYGTWRAQPCPNLKCTYSELLTSTKFVTVAKCKNEGSPFLNLSSTLLQLVVLKCLILLFNTCISLWSLSGFCAQDCTRASSRLRRPDLHTPLAFL